MRSASSLPQHISPLFFFEELLVEWFDEIFSPPPLLEEVQFEIQFEFTGDGGGIWTLRFDLGDYSVKRARSDSPLLSIQAEMSSWELTSSRWIRELAAELERAGGVEEYIEALMEKERQRGRQLLRLTEAKLKLLTQHPTVFEGLLDNFEGQQLSLRAGLAIAPMSKEPDFQLRMDGDTLEAMRLQTLHPMDAWSQKRIQLKGNLNLALKLGKIVQKDI